MSVSRYSSRKYSSPKTLAMLARLISSMTSTNGLPGGVARFVGEPLQRPGLHRQGGAATVARC